MRTDMLNLLVESRLGNFTFLDIHYQSIIGTNKTNVQSLLKFVPLAANHDPIAIGVRRWTRHHRGHDFPTETADPLEQISDLLPIDFQLPLIDDMLVLATAAIAKIAA